MRIIVFSTDDFLYPAGGAEVAMGEIMKRLPHIEFDLICAKLRKNVKSFEKIDNVNIWRLGFGIPKIDGFILAIFGYYKAKQLISKNKYDLVWSIMASYGAFSASRIRTKFGNKINLPFLLTLQEGDSFEYILNKTKFVKNTFKNIFVKADALQAISKYLLEWGENMGFEGKIKAVVPNGVDLKIFGKRFGLGDVLRQKQEFGFPSDAKILITSSRLVPKNAIEDVVVALKALPSNVCFVICGSGSLESEINDKVETLGLRERVKFMGFVPIENLPLLFQSSDIFIRPSISEGLGTAFLEAMASKIPVVGTMVGGIPDFLVPGENGFEVLPENPESITKTLENIFRMQKTDLDLVTESAYKMVIENYSSEIVAEKMEGIFNSLNPQIKQ